MSALVSIVIPTYNVQEYIEQTLVSVLSQSYSELEVIVVDDGSTDGTSSIVQRFAATDSRVCLITQSNQGVCVARNRGFAASRGQFLCFLDHDDYWAPWKLAEQIAAFERTPQVGVVFTAFRNWFPQDGVFATPESELPALTEPPSQNPSFSGWIYHQFLLDCWALTSSVMIRRQVLESFGAFDESLPYSEDWELWLRLSAEVQFVMLSAESTLYRQHQKQGNRKLRAVDYRTQLLESTVARCGLASRDGRSLTLDQFSQNVARYHMQFGLHHLQHGSRRVAIGAFWRASRRHPGRLKYLALIGATLLGWRPRPPAH